MRKAAEILGSGKKQGAWGRMMTAEGGGKPLNRPSSEAVKEKMRLAAVATTDRNSGNAFWAIETGRGPTAARATSVTADRPWYGGFHFAVELFPFWQRCSGICWLRGVEWGAESVGCDNTPRIVAPVCAEKLEKIFYLRGFAPGGFSKTLSESGSSQVDKLLADRRMLAAPHRRERGAGHPVEFSAARQYSRKKSGSRVAEVTRSSSWPSANDLDV